MDKRLSMKTNQNDILGLMLKHEHACILTADIYTIADLPVVEAASRLMGNLTASDGRHAYMHVFSASDNEDGEK